MQRIALAELMLTIVLVLAVRLGLEHITAQSGCAITQECTHDELKHFRSGNAHSIVPMSHNAAMVQMRRCNTTILLAPQLSVQDKQFAYRCINHWCQSNKLKVLQSKVIQRQHIPGVVCHSSPCNNRLVLVSVCWLNHGHGHFASINWWMLFSTWLPAWFYRKVLTNAGTDRLFSHAKQEKFINLGGIASRTFVPCLASYSIITVCLWPDLLHVNWG